MTISVMGVMFEAVLDRTLQLVVRLPDGTFARAASRAELEGLLRSYVKRTTREQAIDVVIEYGERRGVCMLRRATLRREHATRRGSYLCTLDGESVTIDTPIVFCRGGQISDEQIAAINGLEARAAEARAAAEAARKAMMPREAWDNRDALHPRTLLTEAARQDGAAATDEKPHQDGGGE